MYLVFTRIPGKIYRRQLWSSLWCLCDVSRTLINSLVCRFYGKLRLPTPTNPATVSQLGGVPICSGSSDPTAISYLHNAERRTYVTNIGNSLPLPPLLSPKRLSLSATESVVRSLRTSSATVDPVPEFDGCPHQETHLPPA